MYSLKSDKIRRERQNSLEKKVYNYEKQLQNSEVLLDKDSFSVYLLNTSPEQRAATIKILRSLTGASLKDAVEMIDNPTSLIKADVSKEEALAVREKLKTVNAEVDIV